MVLPFFFLPIIYDVFGLGKSGFLLLTGVIGMVLWVIGLIAERKNEIKYSKWLWWIVIFFIWSIISFLKMSGGGQARSITLSLGIGGLTGLVIWSFLWLQVRSEEETKKQILFLTVSGLIVGITSLAAFLIPTAKMPFSWPNDNPIVVINDNWTLTGSIVGEAVFFLFLTIVWLKKLLTKLKNKVNFEDYFKEALAVAFLGLMTLLDVYKLIKLGWVYLDINSAWVIAVETLKNNPIFGVGPGNFIEAFSRFRPTSFNFTRMWTNTFGTSTMGILNIWTEFGVVGLVIVSIIGSMMFKNRKKNNDAWIMILLGIMALILPPTFLIFFLLFWFLSSNWGEIKTIKMILPLGEKGFNIMPYLISMILLGLTGFGGYKMTKVVLGDYFWKQSLLATSKNDGSGAYNNQIKAIRMNPKLADYRAVYAQTNLALSKNFLNVENGNEISQEDKDRASALIQQAVREAQSAVTLDKNISAYWTNLGSVYKSLVGLVDNTLDWSVQSYQQAAIFDPANPNINMELGSIAYGTGDYASAERYFEEVVKDKNDLANAWYNWAYAAKNQNKLQEAVTRLDQAVKLVSADSEDYEKANKELDAWKKELDEAIKKYQQQLQQEAEQQQAVEPKKPASQPLTTPAPLPKEGEEERVNVPATDLEPPEVSPAPEVEN